MEVFTKTKSDHCDLLQAHVWGCPAYVLDPKLADGKKIPKWNCCSRLGQFLGFSDEHSSLVGRIRNLTTNYVSPLYYVVYDDLFQTIFNGTSLDNTTSSSIFDLLFDNCRDWYGEVEHDENGVVIYEPPPLEDVWLSEMERREKRGDVRRRRDADRNRQLAFDWELEEQIIASPDYSPDDDDDGRLPPLAPVVSDDESSDDDDSIGDDDDSIGVSPRDHDISASEGAEPHLIPPEPIPPDPDPPAPRPEPRRSQR